MKKYRPLVCGVFGLSIYGIHALLEHWLGALPDEVSIPMMVVSILLMMIGIAYSGYLLGKGKNHKNNTEADQQTDKH